MKALAVAAALLVALAGPAQAADQEEFISIGTGGLTGVYYPTGGAICRLVNHQRKAHGLRCSVEATGGSIFNLNTLRNGELDFGIAQSDWQYHALKGGSEFSAQGPFDKLRAVFSIHSEPFTLMARADSGIESLRDLKGKRVNIGNPGSGQRGTMEVLMKRLGWTRDDFALTAELKATEQARALCDNKIDAMVYTVGHPNASIKEASTACDAVLVPVAGPEVDALVEENPYYAKAVIPAGMYRGADQDTPTFGVKATLVTHADVSEEAVYQVTKAVFDNLDTFRKLHPAFANLTAESMRMGNSAPLHPGTERYFDEQ